MNLKEAFAYQNFLNRMLDSADRAMARNATKTTKEHLRSKAVEGAVDENEEVLVENPLPIDKLIAFAEICLKERAELCSAIEQTKQAQDFSMDVQYDLNRKRRQIIGELEAMLKVRRSEKVVPGSAYKINAEGNQVPYRYDVKVVSEANFDRETVRTSLVALRKEADDFSVKLDQMLVTALVDFVPRFDVNDDFMDVIEQFIEQ